MISDSKLSKIERSYKKKKFVKETRENFFAVNFRKLCLKFSMVHPVETRGFSSFFEFPVYRSPHDTYAATSPFPVPPFRLGAQWLSRNNHDPRADSVLSFQQLIRFSVY